MGLMARLYARAAREYCWHARDRNNRRDESRLRAPSRLASIDGRLNKFNRL